MCERAADIPLLAHYFLKRYNERYHLDTRLTESGLKAMAAYSWPGNIRQLQHMMERLTILAPSGRIDAAAVRDGIEQMDSRDNASDTLADTEAEQIRRVMAATNGNKSRAARVLGIERKTLYPQTGKNVAVSGRHIRATYGRTSFRFPGEWPPAPRSLHSPRAPLSAERKLMTFPVGGVERAAIVYGPAPKK